MTPTYQKFPNMPYLRPPVNSADAAERVRLLARAINQRDEIHGYFDDIAHWNRLHPHETPIDPDPDGQMAELLRYLNTLIAGAVD
jgi:hypothetical protein